MECGRGRDEEEEKDAKQDKTRGNLPDHRQTDRDSRGVEDPLRRLEEGPALRAGLAAGVAAAGGLCV